MIPAPDVTTIGNVDIGTGIDARIEAADVVFAIEMSDLAADFTALASVAILGSFKDIMQPNVSFTVQLELRTLYRRPF
jgi:hypothetical protein